MKRIIPLAFAALVSACATPEIPATVDMAVQTMPPAGYVSFCVRNPDECGGGTDEPRLAEMTPAKWSELVAVNDFVNRLPQFEDGKLDLWRYAGTRGGDCEDFALEKRRLLIERGWPVEGLLLAMVREWNGDGHAVLLVLSDAGQFVLDNKFPTVDRVADAPYQWVKVQSARRPFIWLSAEGKVAPEYPPLGAPVPFLVAAGVAE